MAKLKYLGMMILCGLSTFSIQQTSSQVTLMSTDQITRQALTMTGNSLSNAITTVANNKGTSVDE